MFLENLSDTSIVLTIAGNFYIIQPLSNKCSKYSCYDIGIKVWPGEFLQCISMDHEKCSVDSLTSHLQECFTLANLFPIYWANCHYID